MSSERQFPQDPFSAEIEGPFHIRLPFSDLSEWLPSCGIYDEAVKSLPLTRLGEIKTLSFLTFVGPAPESQYFTEFHHNRLDHSLLVAKVTEYILERNGFPRQTVNLGILAGLLHDVATPAHGDTTKLLDPSNLSEENFWQEAVGEKGLDFLLQHNVRPPIIDKVIKGQGCLGKVLDVADRITYVMQDLSALGVESPQTRLDVYLREFNSLFLADPKIGNIYQEVVVDGSGNEVVFIDPRRLGIFLQLRAILHKRLYLNPVSQGRDLFVANLLRPLYSVDDSSLLTPRKLRQMTDDELMRRLYEYYHPNLPDPGSFSFSLLNFVPSYQKFTSRDEADQCAQRLSQNKGLVIIGTKESPGFDPATSYKVRTQEGKFIPFRELDPGTAAKIEEIARSTYGFYLFYTKKGDFPLPLKESVR